MILVVTILILTIFVLFALREQEKFKVREY